MPGNCCEITDQAFPEADAREDLRDYSRHGPAEQTRELLAAIRSYGLKDATLLDIGGGIGVIYHELLGDVVQKATHVDASSAYLRTARAEAERRGHVQHVEFIHADFTTIASDLPPADIVTLDRVVCCYPDFRGLLRSAAGRTGRLLAMTYPRETWYMRMVLGSENWLKRLRKAPFRVFLHPVREMERLLEGEGLRRIFRKQFLVWEMAAYARE